MDQFDDGFAKYTTSLIQYALCGEEETQCG
jgi:hypothetical protein